MKRKANTLAVCSAAVSFKKCNAEIVRDVRIAVGAVTPIPLRIKKAEAFVEGNRLDRKLMEDLRKIIHEEIAPITDGRSTAWFRKQVTPVLVERCFMDAY